MSTVELTRGYDRLFCWLFTCFSAAVGWGFYFMPQPVKKLFAYVFGLMIRKLKYRAGVVRQNLAYAYPGQELMHLSIEKKAYESLFFLAAGIFMLFGPIKRFIRKKTVIIGLENWKEAHAQGKGVLLLASHVGHWEIMAAAGGLNEMAPWLVTKRIKPQWLLTAIQKARANCNVSATYEPRTLRDIERVISAGGTVGFVLDQYTGPPVGVRVPVFGIPVGTHSVVAMLALRKNIPVVPVFNYWLPDGRFQIEVGKAIAPVPVMDSLNERIAKQTAVFAKIIESQIYQCPDQWLWIHRRFKGDLSALRENEWKQGRRRREASDRKGE